jgi:hypothetical protein
MEFVTNLAKSFARGQPYSGRIRLTLFRNKVHETLKIFILTMNEKIITLFLLREISKYYNVQLHLFTYSLMSLIVLDFLLLLVVISQFFRQSLKISLMV